MRVSSLSNERVIDLVSRYFVPVWLSRDSYQQNPRSREEQRELNRIDAERKRRKMEGGSVSLNIVGPDGSLLATQDVHHAGRPEVLVPLLEELIRKEGLKPRAPEAVKASATPQGPVRPTTEGGLVLHIRTRFEGPRARYGLGEDRVELTTREWRSFLPEKDAEVGAHWQVPEKVTVKLFRHFYPPSPTWKASASTVLTSKLTARLVSASEKEVSVSLQGELSLSYPFGRGKDGQVRARLAGVVRYDPERQVITSFLMASEEAEYAWMWKGKPQPEKMVIAVEQEPDH